MSVLPRLAAATAADSSVAFDNLLFGNKHNMTSFRRLVITIIKNVSLCARTSVCACVKMYPSEITKECAWWREGEGVGGAPQWRCLSTTLRPLLHRQVSALWRRHNYRQTSKEEKMYYTAINSS